MAMCQPKGGIGAATHFRKNNDNMLYCQDELNRIWFWDKGMVNPIWKISNSYRGKQLSRVQEMKPLSEGQKMVAVAGIDMDKPKAATKASEQQVGGDHYLKMGIQPLEYTYANYGLFGLKAAIHTKVNKYFRIKGDAAKELEDLKKAAHVMAFLIEKAESELYNK